jgi:DNA-binding NtrC family response regulator
VRELQHAVARVRALGDAAADDIRATPGSAEEPARADAGRGTDGDTDPFDRILGQNLPLTEAREKLVGEFERRYVERILAHHGGNVARAAAASGLARRYFQLLHARYRGH